LKVLKVPKKYPTTPAEVRGVAVNVGEAYARFAKGPEAQEPAPDFDAVVVRHRLLDAVERSVESRPQKTDVFSELPGEAHIPIMRLSGLAMGSNSREYPIVINVITKRKSEGPCST
jgi:hypothetical protein